MDAPSITFERVAEPRENAFTVLVPQGWQLEGGIMRADLGREWLGPQNIEPKLDLTVKRDDQGSVMIRACPEIKYCDPRYLAATYLGITYEGGVYNGLPLSPLMSPTEYLQEVVFPWAHPDAAGVEVVEEADMPELVERYRSHLLVPSMIAAQYAGGMVVFSYAEGDVRLREKAYTVIESLGPLILGPWSNKNTILHRAPEDEFDEWEPILQHIQDSVEINPAWLMEQRMGQAVLAYGLLNEQAMARWRFQRLLETQRDTQDTLRRMWDHRSDAFGHRGYHH